MDGDETTLNPHDVLELNAAVKLPELKLDAREGFVLSQVDGMMTVTDLKHISSIPEKELHEILNKLVNMEALKIKEGVAASSSSRKTITKNNNNLTIEERVRAMYLDLESLNYYELLEIKKTSPSDEVKKAYYQKTKQFHPDKFFRGEDVEVRERLQAIFARINEAYKVLKDKTLRKEYDKDLGKYEKETRRDGVKSHPRKAPTPPPKQQIKNPFTDNILKAKRLFEGAVSEIKRKNYASARQNLKIAQSLDPYNKKYPETLARLSGLENIDQAQNYYQSALEYESNGKHKEAARLYREAMLLDTENPIYYTRLARINFEKENNAEVAKKLLQKAIDLKPKDPEPYLLLGFVYKKFGQTAVAISQFEKGLEVAPNNKELLKELKKAKKGK